MSRGWESKSVESQMESAASERTAARRVLQSEEQIRRDQQRESLLLSRKRVLHDLETATHERYRQQLQAALQHLDQQLKDLG